MPTLSWFKSEKRGTSRHENPDEAIARYLEELRQADVNGTSPPASALNGLGDAYLDKGDAVSAADHYRQAAEAYAREGMYDAAIACSKKIRRYAPDDEQAGLLLGRYYAAKGLRADAARELEAHAERLERGGRTKEAIEALTELVRLAPERALQREKLARLLAEHGQHDAALEEFRAARREYERQGDEEGVARVAERIAATEPDRGGSAARPEGPRERTKPAAGTATPRSDAAIPAAVSDVPPIPLELEHTSYDAEPAPGDTGPEELSSDAVEDPAREPVARPGDGVPPENLAEVAVRLGEEGRWEESVEAYRELARTGQAAEEQLEAWAEAARQAGTASLVLEALAFQARWHLEGGRRASARRAAEEMLLVDPNNATAGDILGEVRSTLPRD